MVISCHTCKHRTKNELSCGVLLNPTLADECLYEGKTKYTELQKKFPELKYSKWVPKDLYFVFREEEFII